MSTGIDGSAVEFVAPTAPPLPRYKHADAAEPAAQLEESTEELGRKIADLADAIRKAKHLVAFTGAGISTAAGVPDFRGERGLDKVGWMSALSGQGVGKPGADVKLPTFAHAALALLEQKGLLKAVVTSNHDNFHVLSGLPERKVTAIFGNGNVETCLSCHTSYSRHTQVPQLGRTCDDPACGGRLKKHGVRFGGTLNQDDFREARHQARRCDVALVLGSGLGVAPFCELPTKAKRGAYICALQATPYDHHRKVVHTFHAKCDDVMRLLLKELQLIVPDFVYRQPLQISWRNGVLILASGWQNEGPTCVEAVSLLGVASSRSNAKLIGDSETNDTQEFEAHRLHWEFAQSNDSINDWAAVLVKYRSEYNVGPFVVAVEHDAPPHEWDFEKHVTYYSKCQASPS